MTFDAIQKNLLTTSRTQLTTNENFPGVIIRRREGALEPPGTRSSDLAPPLGVSPDLSDTESEIYDENGKPVELWTGDDFPERTRSAPRGFDRLLQGYADIRRRIFNSEEGRRREEKPVSVRDEKVTESICCSGIPGLFVLLGLLLVSLFYVAYCCHVSSTDDPQTKSLLVLAAVLWFGLLVAIFRRLVHQGHVHGGCLALFSKFNRWLSDSWSKTRRWLKTSWVDLWNRGQCGKNGKARSKICVQVCIISAMILVVCLCLLFLVILVDYRNLISLSGVILNLLFCIAISRHPGKINWQPVLVGLFLQFVLGLVTLRTKAGYEFFEFLGEMMKKFLRNSAAGSSFVFGDLLPFGFTKVMGTTGPETLNAIANMFVGMTEAPLITRPYLNHMTGSELHSIMVNGFASVAGSVLAAYVKFGVSAQHLLIACVMSAPAGLAVSKVLYPETKRAPLSSLRSLESVKIKYTNIVEAAMAGAMDAVPIVAGIAANLIAFLSLYQFMNNLLIWFGERAKMPTPLTFELMFSYLLWPVAFTMGVPQEDCFKVAELIGVKMMLNEFAAYKNLGKLIDNQALFRQRNTSEPYTVLPTGDWRVMLGNSSFVILKGGALLTNRAVIIGTYCLCGFANIGSVGIMLASMVTILPHRRKELTGMVLSSMIGGTVACFLTACFAGKLIVPYFKSRLHQSFV
ncbi:hypothetical protein AAHC03_09699 [Spirometra sp. Aus1]